MKNHKNALKMRFFNDNNEKSVIFLINDILTNKKMCLEKLP